MDIVDLKLGYHKHPYCQSPCCWYGHRQSVDCKRAGGESTLLMHKNISEQQARAILAENLRRCRASQGISQETLASLAGVHRTFVGQIERELKNVSLETLVKLANALEVNPFELLKP